jgi:hypothetical protein
MSNAKIERANQAKLSMLVNPGGHWATPANFGDAAISTCTGDTNAWLAANSSPVLPEDPDRAAVLAYTGWIDYWLNYYDAD